ncbi:MAG: 5-carboxymethyl-2-hydroxymuconate Delta-isomerase [Anaerolineales bacterium]|nr:5-carboxymethyl-2-hydroxymuconate Delta-isomerase [Chloroflexota bacterium]MBL6981380.1 5-carboxymethyl-2-hydroxymuconate Delta-isomerase [Anaerolineales bacterium]
MPQISLEYTRNITPQIDSANLFPKIHQILGGVARIPIDNCKSRANRLDDFYIADGEPANAFVHLEIRFIEGRSPEVKTAIGEQCLEQLETYFVESTARLNLQITVEILDIHKQSYFKFPKGTL